MDIIPLKGSPQALHCPLIRKDGLPEGGAEVVTLRRERAGSWFARASRIFSDMGLIFPGEFAEKGREGSA
jgi:hypothetical protein